MTGPNLISISRLVAVAALAVAAATGSRIVALGLLGYALVSDVVDGRVARALHQTTVLGARLDSAADCAMYLSAPFVVMWLFPAAIARIAPAVVVVYAAYLIPICYGALKYRRLTSYHTVGARMAGVMLTLAGILVLVTGIAWPFYGATAVLVLSALDEILITWTLPGWHPNVPSAWHATRTSATVYGPRLLSPIPLERP